MPVDWKARIAAAEKARDAAKASLSASDRDELAARSEFQRIEEERLEAEREKRDLELQRRFESAQESLGPKAKLLAFPVDLDNSFVLRYAGPKAHAAWEKGIAESSANRKLDRSEITREYAMASVYDWNGSTDLHGMASERGLALLNLMKEYPGIATSIVNEAVRLAGLASEERKS